MGELTILVNSSFSADLPGRIAEIAPGARIVTHEQFAEAPDLIGQVDIVLGRLKADSFPMAVRLKWVQCYSAGMDWAQHDQVRCHPAVLTNARIHAAPISEHLFGMLLMLSRSLHEAHRHKLAGRWQRPPAEQIGLLSGKTLCVVGLGVIGRTCAALGEAFAMEVIGVRRRPQPTEHVSKVYGQDELAEALAQADVVMVILPGTARTDGLIGRNAIAAMKRGALLLNAGRGKTVDTDALVEALAEGRLGGAGLDVVDPEPLPQGHPLWQMPNVVITAHYSGMHPGYDRNVEDLFVANLRRFVNGQELEGVVDKQEGY